MILDFVAKVILLKLLEMLMYVEMNTTTQQKRQIHVMGQKNFSLTNSKGIPYNKTSPKRTL